MFSKFIIYFLSIAFKKCSGPYLASIFFLVEMIE